VLVPIARIERFFLWLARTNVHRIVALLVASLTLIGLTSALAVVAGDRVNFAKLGWGGAETVSYWARKAQDTPVTADSRRLDITERKHRLVATYTVTFPASSPFVRWLTNDPARDDGDDLVSSMFGTVSIGEFAYGFTGPNVTWTALDFQEPRLRLNGPSATVTVASTPYAAFLDRVTVSLDAPDTHLLVNKDQVGVPNSSGQARVESGLSLVTADKDRSSFDRDGHQRARLEVAREPAHPRLTQVRGLVAGTMPVLDPTLVRLAELALIAVFLWALSGRPSPTGPDELPLAATRLLFAGFAAVAILGLANDTLVALHREEDATSGGLLAGPTALLLAGAVFVWPLMCFQLGPRRGTRPPRLLPLAVPFCLIPVYGVCLTWLSGLTAPKIVALVLGAVPVVGLTCVVLYLVYARTPPWPALVGVPTVALSAINMWPMAYWTYFRTGVTHVNAAAKWFYVIGGAAAILGLCLLAVRLIPGLAGKAIGTSVVALSAFPSVLIDARPWDDHTVGRTSIALFGLFDSLWALTEWMLLGLVALSLVSVMRRHDAARAAVRRHGIAAGVLVFFYNESLLYIPVSRLVGFVFLVLAVLPAALTLRNPPRDTAGHTLQDILGAWRGADLAKKRIDSLESPPVDDLRDMLINEKMSPAEFVLSMSRLDRVDRLLEARRRQFTGRARRLKSIAFGHLGADIRRHTVRLGAAFGAVFGVVPFAITLFTMNGPLWSGDYPLLSFLGNTAWWYLSWPAMGLLYGLLLPLIRGKHGIEKGLWLFLAIVASSLPTALIWNDNAADWLSSAVNWLEFLIFCIMIGMVVGDLPVLRAARLGWLDWTRVHNWRLIVTWSTALTVALAAAAAAFVSSTATEWGKMTADRINGSNGSSRPADTMQPSPAASQK